jgi:hypothetical protein
LLWFGQFESTFTKNLKTYRADVSKYDSKIQQFALNAPKLLNSVIRKETYAMSACHNKHWRFEPMSPDPALEPLNAAGTIPR